MNIPGLDYNTQREKLVLPEYGREVQEMVDYCMTLPTKAERQSCANTIVTTMERMNPRVRQNADYKQKLWDHLAIMSNFRLDIDWPIDLEEAKVIQTKPQPLAYPMSKIPVRHYGKLVFELFEKLKTMPAGRDRDDLVSYTANQMKRDLVEFGHVSDDEKVASDLARFTDGKIQLDLNHFRFAKVELRPVAAPAKKKRRR